MEKTNKSVKKTIGLSDIIKRFQDHNREKGYIYGYNAKDDLSAVIVYKQSNFTKEYSEVSRSYRVTNAGGKRFFVGMAGSSIFGECLDGSEGGVRLDAYNWLIEKCYFEN